MEKYGILCEGRLNHRERGKKTNETEEKGFKCTTLTNRCLSSGHVRMFFPLEEMCIAATGKKRYLLRRGGVYTRRAV